MGGHVICSIHIYSGVRLCVLGGNIMCWLNMNHEVSCGCIESLKKNTQCIVLGTNLLSEPNAYRKFRSGYCTYYDLLFLNSWGHDFVHGVVFIPCWWCCILVVLANSSVSRNSDGVEAGRQQLQNVSNGHNSTVGYPRFRLELDYTIDRCALQVHPYYHCSYHKKWAILQDWFIIHHAGSR